jgi:acyl-CoA thioesterase-1
LQSWVEILRHLIQLRRPEEGITVINGGLSAHTTTMILRRWPATLTTTSPALIICALGGNDVTRVGSSAHKSIVSRDESIANLRELRRIAAERTTAKWVWMTPTPVLEDRVQQYPPFRFGASEWRNADIVPLAQAMTEFGEPTVDLTAAFAMPADPNLLGPDGVHPTLAGQRAITIALLKTSPQLDYRGTRDRRI